MENQPTVILLLFTDYLSNLDSLAFFRLNHSFWAAHRSPSGRYRLKTTNNEKFLRPSKIPEPFLHSPLSSPSFGHYLVDSLRVYDFSLFSSPPPFFHQVKNLSFNVLVRNSILLNQERQQQKIPDSVKNIVFTGVSPVPWERLKEILPGGVEKLDFSQCEMIDDLTSLEEERLKFSCFPQLEDLRLWRGFNSSLSSVVFPSSLRILSFSESFAEEIPEGRLPENLEKILFSLHSKFNRPLPSRLPRNLKVLELGGSFNSPIRPGQLPEGLKVFKLFSVRFLHPLELGVFPQGLEEIILSNYCIFGYPLLPGLFPDSLKRLDLRFSEYSHPLPPLPNSLESLYICLGLNYSHTPPPLPSQLRSLSFNDSFHLPMDFPQLRNIKFLGSFDDLPVGIFPSSLEEIEFLCALSKPLTIGIFPPGIKKITFGKLCDMPLARGIFPQGIHTIQFESLYSHPLEVGLFPSSVRKLRISTAHPLPMGIFPEGLESIEFCPSFSQPLLPGIFPSSLRSLKFLEFTCRNSMFSHQILPGLLPPFLCELQLPGSFCSFFPLSALPPYFLPDSPSYLSDVPHRLSLSISNAEANPVRSAINYLKILYRTGWNGEFLMKSLRVSISSWNLHFLAEPLHGDGEAFIFRQRSALGIQMIFLSSSSFSPFLSLYSFIHSFSLILIIFFLPLLVFYE